MAIRIVLAGVCEPELTSRPDKKSAGKLQKPQKLTATQKRRALKKKPKGEAA
jgi:hypothetical protein